MRDFLASLVERTSDFGNHYRKYLQALTRNLDHLVGRLEERKKRDQIHILHPAYDFGSETRTITEMG